MATAAAKAAEPDAEVEAALAEVVKQAREYLAMGHQVGVVALDAQTAEWVELQRKASAAARRGKRTMITGGGGLDDKGVRQPYRQVSRQWTTSDELTRLIKQQKAVDPVAAGGTGPRGDFNEVTGRWE